VDSSESELFDFDVAGAEARDEIDVCGVNVAIIVAVNEEPREISKCRRQRRAKSRAASSYSSAECFWPSQLSVANRGRRACPTPAGEEIGFAGEAHGRENSRRSFAPKADVLSIDVRRGIEDIFQRQRCPDIRGARPRDLALRGKARP